jgi:hypothetical protein
MASMYWEPGAIRIYNSTVHAGITLPLEAFVCELLSEFSIPPGQIVAHGWRVVKYFITECNK